tara:strand:- start:66 stop:746 length:681 start_codon:yes stop_codon:yes gene_type:complete
MSNSLPSSPVRTFQDYKIYADEDNNYTNGTLTIADSSLMNNGNNNNNGNRPIVHTMTSLSLGLSAMGAQNKRNSNNNDNNNNNKTNNNNNNNNNNNTLINNMNNNNNNNNNNTGTNNKNMYRHSSRRTEPINKSNSLIHGNDVEMINTSPHQNDNNNNATKKRKDTDDNSPQIAMHNNLNKKNNVNVLKTIQSSSRPLYNYINNENINGMLNFDVSIYSIYTFTYI